MEKAAAMAIFSLKQPFPLYSLLRCHPLRSPLSAALHTHSLTAVSHCDSGDDCSGNRILSRLQSDIWACGAFWRVQVRPFSGHVLQKTKRPLAQCALAKDEDEVEEKGADEKKSKGQKKREALRAVDWGKELASLSHSQLEKAVKWASLSEDILDAAKLAKSINPKVRSGRRRQFNYLGSLLRDAEPELMEMVIKASKNGEDFHMASSSSRIDVPDKEEDEHLQKSANELD
ncbi:hypothetical protein O6H91_08G014300 [Diphasiastrum complanatum]|uniref:Uncharacterized protein n=1 Tax=Diphasiastrum complanatum TaxID=34168 RepID=A0ACC2CV64_DIPCM|nr:hypothetical protein O6H91_08G014300 [Diphasiastrum complanatum]